MDPFSITFAVIAALSAAYGAYSGIQQGKQQKEMYEYNAVLAQRQAEEERAAAQYSADRQREQGETLKARQRLLYNVSGVSPAGTPSDFLADTARKLEMDAQAIEYGGQSKGTMLELQSNLMRMQGGAAKRAGWWNAGSSLLGAATSISGAYAYKGYTPSAVTPGTGPIRSGFY